MDSVLESVSSKPKNSFEAVVLACHYVTLSEGFRCTGIGEGNDPAEFPEKWNSLSDLISVKYKHEQSSLTFVVKYVRIGERVLVHAMAEEESDKVFSMEISVKDHIKPGTTFPPSSLSSSLKNQQSLEALFKINISRKLVPFLNKEGYEESARAPSTSTSQQQQQQPRRGGETQPTAPRGPPVFVPTPVPVPSPFAGDPLRVPTRGPPRVPFGIGGEDLYPSGPFGPIRGPSFGGGSLIGPRHPGFGDPFSGGFGGGAGGGWFEPGRGDFEGGGLPGGPSPFGSIPPGSVPPGARFDPFGPPGVPGFPTPDRFFPPSGGGGGASAPAPFVPNIPRGLNPPGSTPMVPPSVPPPAQPQPPQQPPESGGQAEVPRYPSRFGRRQLPPDFDDFIPPPGDNPYFM